MNSRLIRLSMRLGAAIALVSLSGCAHLVVLHDPLTANEHNDLGVVYETSGELALAAREYRKSLRLDSRETRTWVNLGNARASAGRWHPAEQCFRHALRISPDDPDALNNLAVALMRQHRHPAEARTLALRAVAAGGTREPLYRATLNEADCGVSGSRAAIDELPAPLLHHAPAGNRGK